MEGSVRWHKISSHHINLRFCLSHAFATIHQSRPLAVSAAHLGVYFYCDAIAHPYLGFGLPKWFLFLLVYGKVGLKLGEALGAILGKVLGRVLGEVLGKVLGNVLGLVLGKVLG
jgi:hypothetical protein